MRRYLPTLLVVFQERMQVIDVGELGYCFGYTRAGIALVLWREDQVMLTVSRLSHMTRYAFDAT